jgi:hypothetical protein
VKVKQLIKFLSKYPPNTVVLGAGFSAEKNEDGISTVYEGELNVAEDRKGQPYLTVYEIKLINVE